MLNSRILFKIVFLYSLIISNTAFSAYFDQIEMYYPESVWKVFEENFRLCRIDSNNALPIYKYKTIKVLFDEDSDKVSDKYKKKLDEFMDEIPKTAVALEMEANTDECGDAEYNQKLALRRGNNVWDLVRDKIKVKLEISGKVKGEIDSSNHSNHDKSVEIKIKYIPKLNFKNIDILDISGSLGPKLWGKTDTGLTLQNIKNFKFKPGSIVYVARDMKFQCEGTKLKTYKPVGDDFYNHAMFLISSLIKGEKVPGYVFTDYGDRKRNRSTIQKLKEIKSHNKITWNIL